MFSGASFAIAALAGSLSTLSPCVLPLLPIVVGSATAAHRFGAVALAAGLAVSFVAIGLFVAVVGFGIGLDDSAFRAAAAIVMLAFGLLLLSSQLQERFALIGGPVSGVADRLLARITPGGLPGQFVVGLLLGAVWSPCVGPTLGAAATLAAQRSALVQVAAMMLLFGLGAAAPLLAIGMVSQQVLSRWRGRLGTAGHFGKIALGVLLLLVGGAILTGADKRAETFLVDVSPAWLIDITTRF